MALIQCDYYSDVLGMSMSMNVILPQTTVTQIGMDGRSLASRHPVLYLLHGLSDDHTIWLRRTSIERYVASLGVAVVMPAVHRSFYTDMKHGYKYWTFISEELPAIARSFFPLSDRREDNFVAGLSMGGYGAFKLALSRPDLFSAAASLSGVLDMANHFVTSPHVAHDMHLIYGGEKVAGTDNDLLYLADRLAGSGEQKPSLFQCCGTEDFLYDENITFLKHLEGKGFDFTYEEEPGDHEWGYWDAKIRRVLEWLPLQKNES
jgi:putative tributyrin esterase